jgi:mono/diheme cytochrome c family protein
MSLASRTSIGALLAFVAVTGVHGQQQDEQKLKVERGKYLVLGLGGCNDCHTPKKMGPRGPELDTSRLLSGHPEASKLPPPPKLPPGPWIAVISGDLTAWSGPWGISYGTNLTPDETTGMGIWTEEMFIKALKTGRHMGTSRPILPPMPWETFRNMSDEDLAAIYAYLRTIPPIKNRVPEAVIAPPPPGAPPAPKD